MGRRDPAKKHFCMLLKMSFSSFFLKGGERKKGTNGHGCRPAVAAKGTWTGRASGRRVPSDYAIDAAAAPCENV